MAKIRPEIIWWFQYSRHANLIRLVTLIIGIIVIIHYMTCIFYPIMKTTWMSRQDCEQFDLKHYEAAIQETLDIDGTAVSL